MTLQYRVVPMGTSWPGEHTAERIRSQFKANWGGTLTKLEAEIRQLRGDDVTLALEVEPRMIRQDGGMRSDARPRTPAVIVSFRAAGTRLSFPCDTYNYWQDNVRAIALAMEALRAVDRHGVRKGAQYEGFKALPGAGQTSSTITAHVAAELVARETGGGYTPTRILENVEACVGALRMAQQMTHPDRPTGSTPRFQAVSEAKRVLSLHHASPL